MNVMIVFFVSGLWHGAALTFVAWGLLNGAYQVVSLLLDPLRKKVMGALHLSGDNLFVKGFRVCCTFFLTCMAWVLFRANSLTDALTAYRALCTLPFNGLDGTLTSFAGIGIKALMLLPVCAIVLAVVDWLSARFQIGHRLNQTVALRYGIYFLLVVSILLFGSYGSGYDPQAFVYFQF